MGVLDDKIRELNALEDQYKRERVKITEAIQNVVRSIGQNPAIKPIGVRCFTINSSELINSPWSPEFHDWERQAELLLNVLNKQPVKKWAEFVGELLSDKKQRNPGWKGVTFDKTLLNKAFLLEVQKRL